MATYLNEINIPNDASMDMLSVMTYVGQAFEAQPGFAQELTIQLGWRPIYARLLVVDPDNPTEILFESVAFQTPTEQVPLVSDYTFALGGLDLVAGEDYAFILDAYVERDRNVTYDEASVGIAASGAYPDGTMFTIDLGPTPAGTREDHLSSGFVPDSSFDLSFFLGFSANANDGFVGTDADDTFYGGSVGAHGDLLDGDDTFIGGRGNDVIQGGKGSDDLTGNSGNDKFFGESGADILRGGTGNDTLKGGTGDDTLKGGDGDDLLFGGKGDDTLLGLDGDDTILASAGHDKIDGGAGFDVLDMRDLVEEDDHSGTFRNIEEIFAPDYGIRVDWSTSTLPLIFHGGEDSDTALAGSAADWIDGGKGDDVLSGGAGDDTVLGGNGRDEIRPGDGNDSVDGGGGNDVIYASFGNDTLDGGDGADTLLFDLTGLEPQSFALVWNMNAGELGTPEAPDANQTANFEHLRLIGDFDITVTGTALNNRLITDKGADLLKGYAGDDLLQTGGGNDALRGGDGADLLRAGRGDDVLSGGDGSDRLIGGKGDDRMTGGLGNDIFIFEDGFGHDVICDFDATADKERIYLVGVTAIETFADLRDNHMSAQGDDVVIDAGGGDTILLLDVDLGDLDRADFLL